MNRKKQQRNTRRIRKVPAIVKCTSKAKMSTLGAKRVTLYPGFLMNGASSGTMKKSRGSNSSGKPEDSFLTEKLRKFLDENSVHSQRITNKHPTVKNIISQSIEPVRSLRSFAKPLEPVPEKNSKSVFKKISDKMFKIPVAPKTDITQPGYHTEEEDCNNNEIDIVSSPQLVQPICPGKHSKTFTSKIQVPFKSNYFPKKSFENIAAGILKQNLIVEGKLPKDVISVDNKAEDQDTEEYFQESFIPVPSRRWVYRTPKNQKIKRRKVKECQLQPALLLDDKTIKIIKPLLNHNGSYNTGFIGKVTEQRSSNMGFFEEELPYTKSELHQRIHPSYTYLESPAYSENDITFVRGHTLGTQLSLPNKNYKRQEGYRDDQKGEQNMFDFHSKPKEIFDY